MVMSVPQTALTEDEMTNVLEEGADLLCPVHQVAMTTTYAWHKTDEHTAAYSVTALCPDCQRPVGLTTTVDTHNSPAVEWVHRKDKPTIRLLPDTASSQILLDEEVRLKQMQLRYQLVAHYKRALADGWQAYDAQVAAQTAKGH